MHEYLPEWELIGVGIVLLTLAGMAFGREIDRFLDWLDGRR